MARKIKGGDKRRETDPASNQFLKYSPPSRTHKEIHRMGREEKGEGRDRGDLGRKRRVKRAEHNQASNHTPK